MRIWSRCRCHAAGLDFHRGDQIPCHLVDRTESTVPHQELNELGTFRRARACRSSPRGPVGKGAHLRLQLSSLQNTWEFQVQGQTPQELPKCEGLGTRQVRVDLSSTNFSAAILPVNFPPQSHKILT